MNKKRNKEVSGLVSGLTSEDETCFHEILHRLKVASGTTNDADLSIKLGLTRSSVSTAKTRCMVPPSWIVNVANLFNVSADWLIFGDERYPDKAPKKTPPSPPVTAPPQEKKPNDKSMIMKDWASDLSVEQFEKLWDQYREERKSVRGWLQIELIQRFPEFLEWLETHQETVSSPSEDALIPEGTTCHYGLPNSLQED